jgi:hypothetical protein
MGIEQDASTLARALRLEREFGAGIFPIGGAQWSHFRRLERFGMLRCTNELGMDLDGEVEGDVVGFELTPEGRAWIMQRQEEADAKLRDAMAADEITAKVDAQERATT